MDASLPLPLLHPPILTGPRPLDQIPLLPDGIFIFCQLDIDTVRITVLHIWLPEFFPGLFCLLKGIKGEKEKHDRNRSEI